MKVRMLIRKVEECKTLGAGADFTVRPDDPRRGVPAGGGVRPGGHHPGAQRSGRVEPAGRAWQMLLFPPEARSLTVRS